MKSIVFLCPFFGELPKAIMPLWLKSCEKNKTIDWIVITNDSTNYALPSNVKIIKMSLMDLKIQFQEKLDFKISLNYPYKLCDFKPLYGFLLNEMISGYDYWGHCDMSDCIFGDLRKFIKDKFLEEYDKILFLGHMTIYKNSEEVNSRFLLPTKSKVNPLEIFGVEENMAFDELNAYSINTIYEEYHFTMKRIDDMYVDISPLSHSFYKCEYSPEYTCKVIRNKKHIFEWDNGKLFDYTLDDNKIIKKEIGYVHFQKRKMKNSVLNDNHFYIIPNGFIDTKKKVDASFIKKYCRNKIYIPYFKLKMQALRYRIKELCK